MRIHLKKATKLSNEVGPPHYSTLILWLSNGKSEFSQIKQENFCHPKLKLTVKFKYNKQTILNSKLETLINSIFVNIVIKARRL
jgi:hypothetical protein